MQYFRQSHFAFDEPWKMSLSAAFETAPAVRTTTTLVRRKHLKKMKKKVASASKNLKNVEMFKIELHVLKWFLYRFKRMFRHEKVFVILSKIKQGLKKFLSHYMNTGMTELNELLPSKISPEVSRLELPSRQFVKWVLFRLLGSSKILVRIIQLSTEAGRFIFDKIAVGWSASYATLAMSITGRILTCTKWLLKTVVTSYDTLRVYVPMFMDTEHFLADWEFPLKICEFIGYVDVSPTPESADPEKLLEVINLLAERDGEGEEYNNARGRNRSGRVRCNCFQSGRRPEGNSAYIFEYEPKDYETDINGVYDENNDADDDDYETDDTDDTDSDDDDENDNKNDEKKDDRKDDKNDDKNCDKKDDAQDNNGGNDDEDDKDADEGSDDGDDDDADEESDDDDDKDKDEENDDEEKGEKDERQKAQKRKREEEKEDENDEQEEEEEEAEEEEEIDYYSDSSDSWFMSKKRKKFLEMFGGDDDDDSNSDADVFSVNDYQDGDDFSADEEGKKKGRDDDDTKHVKDEDVKNEGGKNKDGVKKNGGGGGQKDEVIISFEKIVKKKN